MSFLELEILLGLGAVAVGMVGALTGMGGGVVLVPLLVLGFGVDIRYAIGASLVSAVATSSGAAAAYVREGFTNLRVGMLLEIGTTLGAIGGAWLAAEVSTNAIGVVFGCVLLVSAPLSLRTPRPTGRAHPDRLAEWLRLGGRYPTAGGEQRYEVERVPLGFALMWLAGTLSGLLGIGAGAMKVLALDRAMKLPFKVSTTTSNFMIGVTAAASAGVYLNRGYVDPLLTMPVVLGVLAGALAGARLLPRAPVGVLRAIFALVLAFLAFQMIWNGVAGRL